MHAVLQHWSSLELLQEPGTRAKINKKPREDEANEIGSGGGF